MEMWYCLIFSDFSYQIFEGRLGSIKSYQQQNPEKTFETFEMNETSRRMCLLADRTIRRFSKCMTIGRALMK